MVISIATLPSVNAELPPFFLPPLAGAENANEAHKMPQVTVNSFLIFFIVSLKTLQKVCHGKPLFCRCHNFWQIVNKWFPFSSVVAIIYLSPPSFIPSFFLSSSACNGKFLHVMFARFIPSRFSLSSFLFIENIFSTLNFLPGKSSYNSSDVNRWLNGATFLTFSEAKQSLMFALRIATLGS